MRVAEAMTRSVQLASPDQSIVDAAKMMADCDCGVLPVGENDRLVGMITDRDIVVRALAKGMDSSTLIRDVMSTDVKYCYEDDDLDEVAINMGDLQVRRLPVLSRDKRLIGIISLGDISASADVEPTAEALAAISEPATEHMPSGYRPH
ncbi:CBS domain-containing protein [Noviherbaspirillum aridicola]|uniref:Inosine-5-monophosphate dehydrogenase n=1 Tax=Noviherbaspirillum aridicola TaxID=2849687 RepID=A0ABQ4Q0R3_9BURK|nr:CBS domain-containing protein [Noviherbaspirillum aridicola]GIZ50344.1 inosine-5-monophosphate dehydrogenase [Noviherbaspirillum aridicola]